MTVKLIVIEEGARSDLEFSKPSISIGRAVDNDLRLKDPRVSRNHCLIEENGEGVFVIDKGSGNGTLVNGERVDRKALSPGDIIFIGNTRVCYEAIPPEGMDSGETAFLSAAKNLSDETQLRETARERDNLLALQKINKAINSERNLRILLNRIVDAAIKLTRAERGFLILGKGEETQFEVSRNFAGEPIEMPELKVSRSLTARVREGGQAILSLNAREDDRFADFASVVDLNLLSVICLPLRVKGEIQGVLYVDNRLQKGIFREEDLGLLEGLADQAGIAIENAQLFSKLEESNRSLQEQRKEIEALNADLDRVVAAQQVELVHTRRALARERGARPYSSIIGESQKMKEVFRLLDRMIPTDFPVLIEGESGTGKELIAQAIHNQGPRKDKPFVVQNCAALSESLLESELFGHTKGAFTGAHKSRKGLLEIADGGTLFLDEMGEMSPELQKKLLRFFQEGEIRPVGSDRLIRANVRIVSASNRRLEDLIQQGVFREDLFYRLNVLSLRLPSLREREGDVPILVEFFMNKICRESKRPAKRVESAVMQVLESYDWPGNVRELENEVRKWTILEGDSVNRSIISERILQGRRGDESILAEDFSHSLPARIKKLEIRAIQSSMQRAGGNKSKAAALLGISRFALQRKIDKLGIEVGDS